MEYLLGRKDVALREAKESFRLPGRPTVVDAMARGTERGGDPAVMDAAARTIETELNRV